MAQGHAAGAPGRLHGKVALVTGAGRGIGRGCALCLAEEGADLALIDRDDVLAPVAAEIAPLGRRVWTGRGDMGETADVERLVADASAALGRIDVLVSTVAYEVHGPAFATPPAEFARSLQVGLVAAFALIQRVGLQMRAQGGGKVIAISSVHAQLPFAGAVAYNTFKAGLEHLVRSLANEWAGDRINVNAIAPGWIDTPGERRWYTDAELAEAGRKLPWGRLGTPRDIGRAAVYLASDDADYVTGTVLRVDGGLAVSTELPG